MKRTLEAIFRHPLLLLILIVSLPIVGVAVTYFSVPRTYQSTASVWALQRYFVISDATPAVNDYLAPAQTQVTALNELLQTRTFVLAVTQGIDLGPTLGLSDAVMNDPQQLQDALYSEISKYVVVTPLDYNLYEISYKNRDPKIAQEVVESVITNFDRRSLGLSIAGGQNLLASYQTQLAKAQKNLNDAVSAETQYVNSHPEDHLKLTTDPQYQQFDTQRIQAQAIVQNIQNVMNQIEQQISVQGSDVNTLFQVIDAPQVPDRPLSRTKNYLVGGGIGLGVALLACIIYLVIVVRRNRGVYSARDLQDLVAVPVVMQLSNLTPTAVSLLALAPKTMRG